MCEGSLRYGCSQWGMWITLHFGSRDFSPEPAGGLASPGKFGSKWTWISNHVQGGPEDLLGSSPDSVSDSMTTSPCFVQRPSGRDFDGVLHFSPALTPLLCIDSIVSQHPHLVIWNPRNPSSEELRFYVSMLSCFSCVQLCDPMDCSPPGSSVHGILQARILEWVVIPFSKWSTWLRDWTQVSCICRQILYCLSHQGIWDFI